MQVAQENLPSMLKVQHSTIERIKTIKCDPDLGLHSLRPNTVYIPPNFKTVFQILRAFTWSVFSLKLHQVAKVQKLK